MKKFNLPFIKMIVISLLIVLVTAGCSNARVETVTWDPKKPRFIQIEKRSISEIAKEIQVYEQEHFSDTSGRSMQFIAQKIKEIYATKYGGRTKDIDFVFLSDKAFRSRIKSISPNGITRFAAVSTPVGISLDEADKIVDVMEDARIYINREFPDIRWKDRKKQNILSLFRVLMIHEYIHSQTKLRAWKNGYLQIANKRIPVVYSKGFKSIAMVSQQAAPIYMTLDEIIVQLQANTIASEIDGGLGIVRAGKGQVFIPEDVESSLILQSAFNRIGVNVSKVNEFHRNSDLQGFQLFIQKNKFTKEELEILNNLK